MSDAIELVLFVGLLGWLGLALLSVSAATRRILEARAAEPYPRLTIRIGADPFEALAQIDRARRALEDLEHRSAPPLYHQPKPATLRPFLAWLVIAFLAGAAVMFLAQRVALGAELAPAWRSVTPPAFAVSALEVPYAARHDVTAEPGTTHAGRVSERGDRRGSGGERG